MQEVESEEFALIVHHENIHLPFLYFVHSLGRQLISCISQGSGQFGLQETEYLCAHALDDEM